MCNVMSVAKAVCEACDWSLSNLKLQKMMYILQIVYMGNNKGNRLFNATFEAWDYGPVIPELYYKLKMFGAKPVQDVFWSAEECKNQDKLDFINRNAPVLCQLTGGQLVALTHQKDTAWYNNYAPGARGVQISDADMMKEYTSYWKA